MWQLMYLVYEHEHKHSRIKYFYGKSPLFIYAARATRKACIEEGRLNRTVVSIGEYSTRVERSLDPSMPSTTSNPRVVTQLESEIPLFCTAALKIPAQERKATPTKHPTETNVDTQLVPSPLSLSLSTVHLSLNTVIHRNPFSITRPRPSWT